MALLFSRDLLMRYFGTVVPRIGPVPIDVLKVSEVTRTSTVTYRPIEGGSELPDHVRQQPTIITIDAIISDYGLDDTGPLAWLTAYELLKFYHDTGESFAITLETEYYPDAVFSSLRRRSDKDTATALFFTATVQILNIEDAVFGDAVRNISDEVRPKSEGRVDRGAVEADTAPDNSPRSVLDSISS